MYTRRAGRIGRAQASRAAPEEFGSSSSQTDDF